MEKSVYLGVLLNFSGKYHCTGFVNTFIANTIINLWLWLSANDVENVHLEFILTPFYCISVFWNWKIANENFSFFLECVNFG